MKRVLILILCGVMLVGLFVFPTSATEQKKLSELSEKECIDYLLEKNVDFPDDYEDIYVWGPFVKRIIAAVEEYPDVEFGINYTVTAAFAEEIRNVVKSYYAESVMINATRSTTSTVTKSALEHSTTYCTWNSMYAKYNCYVFALGKVDVAKRDPGYYSGNAFSLALGPRRIAELVKDDLEALGYERIVIGTSCDSLNNPCINEEIICLRHCLEDYHFMKLDGNSWYHKPSTTLPLKYKYAPTPIRYWNNERVIGTTIYKETIVYDSEIYFISYNGHGWSSYTNNQTGTHTRRCSVCNDIETTPCNTEFVSSGATGHYEHCDVCGYSSTTASHNLEYTYTSSNKHKGTCRQCGYTTTENCNSSGYQYYGQVDGVHKHRTACNKCNHVTGTTLISCLFKGTSTVCSHCKHDKGISGGTIMKKPVQTEQQ